MTTNSREDGDYYYYYYMAESMLISSMNFLRECFRRRWEAETGTVWQDNAKHINELLYRQGSKIHKGATPIQKTTLFESSKVEDWNLSMLNFLLQNLGDVKKYKIEYAAITALDQVRIFLAGRLTTKSISKADYVESVGIIDKNLKSLGMKASTIQGFRKDIESQKCSKAYQTLQIFYENASLNENNWTDKEKLECYTEAIKTPNLLPALVAVAYEYRAALRLDMVRTRGENTEQIELAILDIKQALSINNFSWSAHHLAARCYKRVNQLSQAIRHYEQALSLYPFNEQLKNELRSVKSLVLSLSNEDHFKPVQMEISIGDYLKIIKEEFNYMDSLGQNKAPISSTNGKDDPDTKKRGRKHGLEGARHYFGMGVPQDFKKALKHFHKSAKLNDPEGTYFLAKCLQNGDGVERDVNKAFEYYLNAEEMNGSGQGDQIIASAEHAAGRLCFDGSVAHMDFKKAAYWFKKSMTNGHGFSATILGNMYACGLGVDKNMKMAELCWRHGVNLKCPLAFKWLVRYYLNEAEPDMALEYFSAGVAHKNPILMSWPTTTFVQLIQQIKKYRKAKEETIKKFEKVHHLPKKGFTFKQRVDRYNSVCYSDPIIELIESIIKMEADPRENSYTSKDPQGFTLKTMEEIKKSAINGSKTGKELVAVFAYKNQLCTILQDKEELSEDEKLQMLDVLYNLILIGHQVVPIINLPGDKLLNNLKDLMKQEKYLREEGPIDMKLRLCYASLVRFSEMQNDSKVYVIDMLHQGAIRYPENSGFDLFASISSNCFGDIRYSKMVAEWGLKKDPSNVELLYTHACTISQIKAFCNVQQPAECLEERMAGFLKFLNCAQDDHRMVPDAWYRIYYLYLSQYYTAFKSGDVSEKRELVRLAVESLRRGRQAEKEQLACYLPYKKLEGVERMQVALDKNAGVELELQKKVVREMKKNWSILDYKPFLISPSRKLLIRLHRRELRRVKEMSSIQGHVTVLLEIETPSELKQPAVKSLTCLKRITLQKMNPVNDHVFENKFIELTVLDDSYSSAVSSISCVVEDDHGDVIHLHIYNADVTKKTLKKFKAGRRLVVVCPYMKVGNEKRHNCLIVNALKYIIFMEKLRLMCGFCGEENASHKCLNCTRPYCSSECMTLEMERHNHELICLAKS